MPNNGISRTNTNKTTNYRMEEKPKFLVITNSVSPTPEKALLALYRDGNSASVHYFIRKDGKQDQFHLEDNQSFTCGRSKFGEEESLNKTAISVMFINTGNEAYTEEQKAKFKAYLADFKERNPHIDLKKDIVGLGEVAVINAQQVEKDGRQVYTIKIDGREIVLKEGEGKIFPHHIAPGKEFFWEELAELGFGLFVPTTAQQKTEIWVSPASSELEIKALQESLQKYGYAIEASGIYDEATKAWVTRFNQRYVLDPTNTIDSSIWSKASQLSLEYIQQYLNTKTNIATQLPSSQNIFFNPPSAPAANTMSEDSVQTSTLNLK